MGHSALWIGSNHTERQEAEDGGRGRRLGGDEIGQMEDFWRVVEKTVDGSVIPNQC